MEDVERLIKSSLEEIEKVLSSKTVVGEPITFGDNTIVPLVRIAFGFGAGGGAGGGSGKDEKSKGEGSGGAAAGGAWIKPAALIIINSEGVRVEPVTGATGSVLTKAGDIIGKVVEKRVFRGKEKEEEE